MAKSSEQLKKHMILAHNGHKNTSWMFCGDCEYATRVRKGDTADELTILSDPDLQFVPFPFKSVVLLKKKPAF